MFNIPFDYEEIQRSNVLAVGTNSVGKTLASCGICSNLMAKGWKIIVFDTTNAWLTKSDIPYYQTIRDRKTPIYMNRHSMIYELGLLTPTECRNLVEKMCWYIWNKKMTTQNNQWIFTVFEEAETFLTHRGQATENIQRLVHCGRNLNGIRSLFITTDLALLDTSKIRLCEQRYYFRQAVEENSKRKFRSYHGLDWSKISLELDIGTAIYYNRGQIKIHELPLFKPQTTPIDILREKQ